MGVGHEKTSKGHEKSYGLLGQMLEKGNAEKQK